MLFFPLRRCSFQFFRTPLLFLPFLFFASGSLVPSSLVSFLPAHSLFDSRNSSSPLLPSLFSPSPPLPFLHRGGNSNEGGLDIYTRARGLARGETEKKNRRSRGEIRDDAPGRGETRQLSKCLLREWRNWVGNGGKKAVGMGSESIARLRSGATVESDD